MYFSRSIVASALLGLSAATTHLGGTAASAVMASETLAAAGAAATSGAAAVAGEVTTHVVQVGGVDGATVYLPNNVQAQPGDLVQFQFNAKVSLHVSMTV